MAGMLSQVKTLGAGGWTRKCTSQQLQLGGRSRDAQGGRSRHFQQQIVMIARPSPSGGRLGHHLQTWVRDSVAAVRTSIRPREKREKGPEIVDWAAAWCDHVERMIFSWPVEAEGENYFLSECFAPVSERAPTTDLAITGTIPECMYGEFVRVGPNPRFKALGGYHWFDGDGMIHGLHMKNGKATYVVRYVRTSRLQQEERYGAPKFWKIGDLEGLKGCFCVALELLRRSLGVLDGSSKFDGTGNTALVYHNNKLLALHEQDKPYIIKVLEDGDLQTVGLEDYDRKLQHSFAAHPKIDPITGDMFFFAYQFEAPRLIYRVVSKEGVLGEPVLITLPVTSLMHDFAITENYAIFMDLPLVSDPLGMALGGFIIKFDPTKESRLGVLPRYATDDSQIRWFTIPTCYIVHTVCAWEEGDEAVLTVCRMDGIDLNPEVSESEKQHKSFGSSYGPPTLFEYRMNLKTGDVQQRQLSNLPAEFPRINPEYTGRKVRYAYCGVIDVESDHISGVVKYDLSREQSPTFSGSSHSDSEGNIAGVFHHGHGRWGSDAIFVPRKPGMADASEDDGYLISFVHDDNTGRSEAVIIDAKTMAPEPVAVVGLPGRVPRGFHAHFVSQEQLLQQA